MAQTIKIRRGTEAERLTLSAGSAPVLGEILYTTDNKELWIGDGSTTGGVALNYIKAIGTTAQTIQSNLTISGDLTVSGTTTTVNSTEVNIGDSIILLNSGETLAPTLNGGFEIERGTADNVSILWNETTNQWELTKDADDTGTANATTSRILDADDVDFKTVNTDSGNFTAAAVGSTLTVSGGDSISTSGTGSTLTIDVTDNTIGATELNAAAPGGSGKVLTSSTGEGFTWEDAGAATNNATITLQGDGSITATESFTTNQSTADTLNIGHLTTDGHLHVPATSTTNEGKILTAGATAGSISWQDQVSMRFKGDYNASTNSPLLDATPIDTLVGDTYVVSVAGTFFTTDVEVGDVLICEAINATLETQWTIVNKNIGAASATESGTVELATIAEIDTGTDTVRAITPAGLAGSQLQTDVTANNAKETNVTTNLSIGTTTATNVDINSSDGTNATIPAAIATTAAGLLTGADKAKLDAITGSNTGDEVTATLTVQGIVELATSTEINSGTAGALAVTAEQLAASNYSTTVGTVTSVTAGAGMTQTGTSTIDPTLNVIANVDGSIVVNADDIQVGVVDGGTFV